MDKAMLIQLLRNQLCELRMGETVLSSGATRGIYDYRMLGEVCLRIEQTKSLLRSVDAEVEF